MILHVPSLIPALPNFSIHLCRWTSCPFLIIVATAYGVIWHQSKSMRSPHILKRFYMISRHRWRLYVERGFFFVSKNSGKPLIYTLGIVHATMSWKFHLLRQTSKMLNLTWVQVEMKICRFPLRLYATKGH